MKMFVCSIYDSATKAYLRPLFLTTIAQGVRLFQDEVNKVDSPMCAHPADYTLFHIGYFDEESGVLEAIAPVSCGHGLQFKDVFAPVNEDNVKKLVKLIEGINNKLDELRQE